MPAWLLAVILVPRLCVFGLAVFHPSYSFQPDSFNYLALAQNLKVFQAFCLPDITMPEIFRVPGYPLFLVPFMFHLPRLAFFISLAQTAVGIFTVLLIWRWLACFAIPRGQIWGTLVVAVDVVAILHAPIILTDTLFLFVLTLAVYRTWKSLEDARPGALLWTALVWGAAPLVRPVGIFLPPLVSLLWVRRKTLFGIFLFAACLLPALWIVRNIRVANFAGLSSQGGIDFFQDTAPAVQALAENIPLEESRGRLQEALGVRYPEGFSSQADQERAYRALGLQTIRRYPFTWLRYEIQGAIKILGGTGLEMLVWLIKPDFEKDPRGLENTLGGSGTWRLLRQYPALIILQAAYWIGLLAAYFFFGLGIFRLWRTGQKKQAVFLAGGVLYFLLLSSHVGTYRLRIPMLPFLAGGVAAAFSGRLAGQRE